MPTADVDVARLMAIRAMESGLLRLKWHAAALRFEIALRRHDVALIGGYNPDEPRVPRGNPDGGQWTGEGGSSGGPPDGPLNGDEPKIPKERPPRSRDRTAALKEVARHLTRVVGTVAEMARLVRWVETYSPQIESYRDPPKSLEELQRAVSTPAAGYDIHHIVEQTAAERDGFTREVIDSPQNLVRIPTMKHQEINAWYQTKSPAFGGLSPREYLRGRNWEVRRSVGLKALVDVGVLKP
jgi:hypothetical protein